MISSSRAGLFFFFFLVFSSLRFAFFYFLCFIQHLKCKSKRANRAHAFSSGFASDSAAIAATEGEGEAAADEAEDPRTAAL